MSIATTISDRSKRLSRLSSLLFCLFLATGFMTAGFEAYAEPYMAVHMGLKCSGCHVNPTGGGKRNEFGSIYGMTTLTQADVTEIWQGPNLNDYVSIGGDLRVNAVSNSIPNQDSTFVFETEEVLLYLEVQLLPDQLTFYVDQRLGPGGTSNREAYGLFWFRDKTLYAKAGRMFLPFGLRLEDDTAFVRQVSGINYNTPDDGVEVGVDYDRITVNLAITNGTAGGNETDTGKQYSLSAVYMEDNWRLGASYNYNDVEDQDRTMAALFGGLRTGKIHWLMEWDYIVDDVPAGDQLKQIAGIVEANAGFWKGTNIKLTYEFLDPDKNINEDERTRWSLVWEYFPIQFTQLSIGYRDNEGIPQNDLQNISELFIQLHNYF